MDNKPLQKLHHNRRRQQQQQRCLWKTNVRRKLTFYNADRQNDDDEITNIDDDDDDIISYESLLERFSYNEPLLHKKSLFDLCSNALVVVQEIALSSYFLARHQISILLQDYNDENQQQHKQQTDVPKQQHLSNFVLTSLLDLSAKFILLSVLFIFYYSSKADQTNQLNRITKLQHRSIDFFLLALLLRFIASILQSLTASYSSDTVQLLATIGMLIHLFCCDYSYANGIMDAGMTTYHNHNSNKNNSKSSKNNNNNSITVTDNNESNREKQKSIDSSSRRQERRPPFLGGTVSLNAALFTNTLLISRLQSPNNHNNINNDNNNNNNIVAYIFTTLTIMMFAFYPVTRHAITVSYPSNTCAAMWIITFCICVAAVFLLIVLDEEQHNMQPTKIILLVIMQQQQTIKVYPFVTIFLLIVLLIGFVLPLWKFYLQNSKVLLRGPWDIPSIASMQLDYREDDTIDIPRKEHIHPSIQKTK